MKATGIVRRIDDLGRVVIPKEIRRTMRIREGDPLEIYTSREGEVIFKKYSPIGELSNFVAEYADTLGRTCDMAVIITDRDAVIATSGISKREFMDRRISHDLENILESRQLYAHEVTKTPQYAIEDNTNKYIKCAMPIITAGDVIGCVCALGDSDDAGNASNAPTETETKLIHTAAVFLSKQHDT